MRILIATSHRNMVGGVEKYLQELLPGLGRRGHELALLYEFRFDPGKERVDPAGLDIPSHGVSESGPEAGLRFVREWKPDVVYSQGMESSDLQSALLNEYPNVLYAHNYVGTCVSGDKCHAFPTPQPCDRRLGPKCLALYYPRRCGGLNPVTAWKLYERSVERNGQLARYTAVLVASAHMDREFRRNGVEPRRIHLVAYPNPHEALQLNSLPPLDSSAGPRLRSNLLLIGRLTNLKGGSQLLKAIPLAEKTLGRSLSITVAGDGPERESMQNFAIQQRLKAKFAGWVEARQKMDLLKQADLLVVPSLWPEPFGLVGIEAGSYGVPAVAYDVGGISDWLIAGYSGELAPGYPPTVQGLADAISRALLESSHYDDLSRAAREVAARFTLAAHLSKLETILENVRLAPTRAEDTIHAEA